MYLPKKDSKPYLEAIETEYQLFTEKITCPINSLQS
jgi:hypothetical protein